MATSATDSMTRIHVDAAYTHGDNNVREAVANFAKSRRCAVIVGVTTGLFTGVFVVTAASFAVTPSLSGHI